MASASSWAGLCASTPCSRRGRRGPAGGDEGEQQEGEKGNSRRGRRGTAGGEEGEQLSGHQLVGILMWLCWCWSRVHAVVLTYVCCWVLCLTGRCRTSLLQPATARLPQRRQPASLPLRLCQCAQRSRTQRRAQSSRCAAGAFAVAAALLLWAWSRAWASCACSFGFIPFVGADLPRMLLLYSYTSPGYHLSR